MEYKKQPANFMFSSSNCSPINYNDSGYAAERKGKQQKWEGCTQL